MDKDRYPENLSLVRGTLIQSDQQFAALREDFLVEFKFNTARAYWGDLEHLNDWLKQYGVPITEVSHRLFLRYVHACAGSGYSWSTIRRRLTCLRAFALHVEGKGANISVDFQLASHQLNDLKASNNRGSTSLTVVSDDRIFRDGMLAVATNIGMVDVQVIDIEALRTHDLSFVQSDYAIVHIWPTLTGLDRLPAIAALAARTFHALATSIIAVPTFHPGELVRLRLAEAGCGYLVEYSDLRRDPERLLSNLRRGSLSDDYALPTQWALRQSIGLRWNGSVEPFLQIAKLSPTQLWTTHRSQVDHKLGRQIFARLQRAARDMAGLPEPAFAKYASSMRRAPELPEWRRVREFVQDLWQMPH